MAGYLRRRGGKDKQALDEPLLGDQDEDSSRRQGQEAASERPSSSGSSAVVPHSINRLDWERLLQALVEGCQAGIQTLWETLAHCFASLRGAAQHKPQLSQVQEQCLRALQAQMAVPYEPDSPQHLETLQQLWSCAFPGEAWPQGLKSQRWTDMGWQRDDPTSDFRGGGYFSLQMLLYLAQEHGQLFRRLLDKSQGQRSAWEYPFAAAGVNLAFMLQEVLDLRDKRTSALQPAGHTPCGSAAAGFLGLLEAEAPAFPEVFCLAFELLDQEWLAMRASYMDFSAVLSRVRKACDAALAAQPPDLATLRRLLPL